MSVNSPSAVVSPGFDAQRVAQRLGDALGAEQRARQRAAHVQHALADRLRVEHRVVGHDVFHVRGAAADLLRHVPHRGAGQIAQLPLRQIQRVENRRLALIGRIVRHVLVELRLVLRRVGERLRPPRPACARTGGTGPARTPSGDESSPVAVSHHDVVGADHRHHVGDQPALDHRRQRLDGHEGRRPHLHAPRPVGAVRHDVARRARRAGLRSARRRRRPAR